MGHDVKLIKQGEVSKDLAILDNAMAIRNEVYFEMFDTTIKKFSKVETPINDMQEGSLLFKKRNEYQIQSNGVYFNEYNLNLKDGYMIKRMDTLTESNHESSVAHIEAYILAYNMYNPNLKYWDKDNTGNKVQILFINMLDKTPCIMLLKGKLAPYIFLNFLNSNKSNTQNESLHEEWIPIPKDKSGYIQNIVGIKWSNSINIDIVKANTKEHSVYTTKFSLCRELLPIEIKEIFNYYNGFYIENENIKLNTIGHAFNLQPINL